MCGIAGFITTAESETAEERTDTVGEMAQVQAHRGPDDQGTWCDVKAGVALGHRRLSIIDLSEQGHQPMLSSCGRFVLVYNGEIYNCNDLREELKKEGRRFRGHSDTEVLVEAISCWGLWKTLSRLQGMFAFAVWNRLERTLTLARDRVGIKPLYYGMLGKQFAFASELKGMKPHPEFRGEIAPSSVALLMRHCYIPAPYSIYHNIRKLPPGTILEISSDQLFGGGFQGIGSIVPTPYWQLDEIICQGQSRQFAGSFDEAVDELDRLLSDAVKARMLGDVPLGAFLSGGIDSSLIVAIMQKQSSLPMKTFTIGFSEYDYDESPYARKISEHIGTDHTELCVMPGETQGVIPQLPELYDEPFADMSQIPTYLVSRLARREVTVCLSGDGGDELFGGYHRYFHIRNIWKKLRRIPARRAISAIMKWYVKNSPWDLRKQGIARYAKILEMPDAIALYAELNRHWSTAEIMAGDVFDPSDELGYGEARAGLNDPLLNWMALDTATYLPDDILTKIDRASMAVSLESRVPLLDHRIVEFAWSLPSPYRFDDSQGKRILRSLLKKYIPAALFERPKVGFGIPIGEWLRGSLEDWAESLLSEKSLNEHGLLNTKLIRTRWEEHSTLQADWQYPLWDVLMFQAWYEANCS